MMMMMMISNLPINRVYDRCIPAEYSVGRLSDSRLAVQGERRLLQRCQQGDGVG